MPTQQQFQKWANEELPIGTKVWYYPVKGKMERSEHEIRSEPWQLGHGDWVVKISNKAGGVSVDHLVRIPETALSNKEGRDDD